MSRVREGRERGDRIAKERESGEEVETGREREGTARWNRGGAVQTPPIHIVSSFCFLLSGSLARGMVAWDHRDVNGRKGEEEEKHGKLFDALSRSSPSVP